MRTGGWHVELAPYIILLRVFTRGQMLADEFEAIFLRMYTGDSTEWPDDLFAVLEEFFGAVDDYCDDESIRESTGGIGANE
jgi:Bacterial self-protective colicin-like immunity